MFRVPAFVPLAFVVGCYSTVVHPTRVNSEFRLGGALSVSVVSDSSTPVESGSTSGFEGGLYLSAVIGDQPIVERDCILFGCLASEGGGGVRTFLVFGMNVSHPLAGDPVRR